jgi:hypothetical protein
MSKEKQPTPVTIYLGVGEERTHNISALKQLARKYAGTSGRSKDGNISGFIKKLIDGDLIIVDPNEYRRQQADPPIAS